MKAIVILSFTLFIGLVLSSCSTPDPKIEIEDPQLQNKFRVMKSFLEEEQKSFNETISQTASRDNLEEHIKTCQLTYENQNVERAGLHLMAGRTSSNLRSPLNAPEPWMVENFEKLKKKRSSKFLQVSENKWAYMEPIFAERTCLKCHSSSASDEVKAKLKEEYLQDHALDYRSGDWMGIYWVTAEEIKAK